MRNLKKVLALALATVMLLGIMAIASAADYTDEAAIAEKHAVAVDVMTAVGVFEGDPAGNFNPAAKLTREQAAKIAVYVALTKDTAKHVAAVDAPFEDVAAARWSAGAIVAAKNLGLIDGWNGKFDPTGELTGYAFAKMMLCVLGYNSTVEGYVGSGWELNVALDAREAGLLAGLTDISLAATLTREQAAQMALNALNAQTVTYAGQNSMIVNGVVIEMGGSLTKGQTLRAKLYPKLTTGTKTDDLGYKYDTYLYDGKECAAGKDFTVKGAYADAADLTKGALYTLVGKATEAVAVDVYLNGADVTTISVTKADYADKTDVLFPTYKGSTFEVVDNDGNLCVMISQAEVAQVAKVTAAAGETKRYITIGEQTYTTEDFAKDEYVFVWKNATKILKVAAIADADKVVGTVTKVTGTNGTAITEIYVAGTKYAVGGTTTALDNKSVTLGADYTVFFQNGYAIDANAVETVTEKATLANYVYVMQVAERPVEPEETAFGAAASEDPSYYETQVVYMDGTIAIVNADQQYTAGKVYEMSENTKGLKVLKDTATVMGIAYQSGVKLNGGKYYNVEGDITARLYFTENSKVMTIASKANGFAKSATLAAPAKTTMANAIFVYSVNTDAKVYEIERIITAEATAAAQDLYYVVGTLLGTVYDATAKTYYKEYTAYDLATGEKLTVKVGKDDVVNSGFFAATITDGVYAFDSATATTREYDAAAKALSVYNGLLTAKDLFSDLDVDNVTVVDAKGGTVNTIAALVAKSNEGTTGKAVEFHTVTISAKLTYIVVTKY